MRVLDHVCMCVSAVLRVSSPYSPCGAVVMSGIQLGHRDLILQEGPAKVPQPGRAGPD